MMTKQGDLPDQSISENAVAPAHVKHHPRSSTYLVLGLFAVFAIFVSQNFRFAVVDGPSMLPTFHTGQRLTVSSAYWLFGPLRDKDVVVLHFKSKTGYIIKRIYKMAGETVDYANSPKDWNLGQGEFVVPKGNVFVLGDNRAQSEDSRYFGPVSLDQIIGKVVVSR